MKKGQIFEGIIERVDFPNKGLVKVEEEGKDARYVTVKNAVPGQKVRFIINKFKKGNAEGRLLEVLENSSLETRKPVCSIFPACGGCMYQTMPYEEQMKMKEGQIRRIMDEAVDGEYLFEGVKASPKEFAYRNKMEFSFGDEYKDGPLSLGLHKKGSTYDVLTASDCKLVHEDMNKILVCVLEYFKERKVSYYKKMQHVGYLRHLLLRRGDTTGEILVNLVTTTQEEHDLSELTEQLLQLPLEGKIVGILHILNDSLSDVVKSDETVVLLSHKKADSYIHIDVEFGEGEGKIPVDSIAKRAEAYKPKEKVTYKMIKEYIEAKYGFKVHTAYIAEVKRNLGLPMYDAPNAVEELKQPRKHPTPEKVEAIKDALRYFAVI